MPYGQADEGPAAQELDQGIEAAIDALASQQNRCPACLRANWSKPHYEYPHLRPRGELAALLVDGIAALLGLGAQYFPSRPFQFIRRGVETSCGLSPAKIIGERDAIGTGRTSVSDKRINRR